MVWVWLRIGLCLVVLRVSAWYGVLRCVLVCEVGLGNCGGFGVVAWF